MEELLKCLGVFCIRFIHMSNLIIHYFLHFDFKKVLNIKTVYKACILIR
jgi:hypothetical protein